jgi:hypothetical protein
MIENSIDGMSLLSLVNDFTEFKYLVPQSGHRLLIKSIIRKESQTPVKCTYYNNKLYMRHNTK